LDLLIPERTAEIRRERSRFPSDRALAGALLDRGWLTPLQERWYLRGRGQRLVVGSYALLDRLGEGGMGHVFLARHRKLERLAAVKVIRPDREVDRRSRVRFGREIRALGRTDHPNVVHAYDAGAVGRSLYVAMEYVPGPDLGRMIAGGARCPAGQSCEFARQAALGLHHMHGRGLVHRDVKPGNLGLAGGGRVVKVLDVGLAKDRTAADTGLTRIGHLVGSSDYAAPEQGLDARAADHRADQYSLGCTLYELLTGSVPFPGGTPTSKALRRLMEDPRPLAELRPNLPPGLVRVVGRLLARSPGDRFASALAAADALGPFCTPLSAIPDDTAVSPALPVTELTIPTLPA